MEFIFFAIAGLIFLALFGFASTIWIWLASGFRKTGYRKILGLVAIQLSLITIAFGLFRADIFIILFGGLLPPAFFYSIFQSLKHFSEFTLPILTYSAPIFIIVFICFFSIKKLRNWSFTGASLAMLFASLPIGEIISQHSMCETAAKYGVSNFARNTFYWSLRNTPG